MARPSATFQLDEEQRAWLRDCLRHSELRLDTCQFDAFCHSIEEAIQFFLSEQAKSDITFRHMHDALRRLYRLADDSSPEAVKKLRNKIARCSDAIIDELVRYPQRARFVPVDFEGKILSAPRLGTPHSETGDPGTTNINQWSEGADFRVWARQASDADLVCTVMLLSCSGLKVVPGRKRETGRRSQPHVEPVILGQALGGQEVKHRGGRPSNMNLRIILISHLAHAWECAGGVLPNSGRSDTSGFGEMAHHIFSWLELKGVEHSLRTYWDDLAEA